MTISLTEDFRTVAELGEKMEEVLHQVRKKGRPVVITADGKPDVVMMTADAYERLRHSCNLARLLAEAEADVRASRTQPLDGFMREFADANKIPRRRRRQRQT